MVLYRPYFCKRTKGLPLNKSYYSNVNRFTMQRRRYSKLKMVNKFGRSCQKESENREMKGVYQNKGEGLALQYAPPPPEKDNLYPRSDKYFLVQIPPAKKSFVLGILNILWQRILGFLKCDLWNGDINDANASFKPYLGPCGTWKPLGLYQKSQNMPLDQVK